MSLEKGKSMFMAGPEDIDPDKNVLATYRVESALPVWEAGTLIATEESVGTWTELTTLTEWAGKNLSAKVFKWKGKLRGTVTVAFPKALFDVETGGIPNILSIVAGNLFGLKALGNVRLIDVEFPRDVVKAFPGPKFGIDHIRGMVGTLQSRRPHLGTIIKPKVGLNPKQTAEVAYEAAVGGVDFIKDDETLTDQVFCPLDDRVARVMEALDKVREETGRKVLYAVNVTSSVKHILSLAERALGHGANMLMVDVLTAGFSTVQMLAEDPSVKVPLHIHRTMHAALTRNPRHGIRMLPLAKLVRLAGGDQLHTGSGAGKMERALDEVKQLVEFLRQPYFNLKNVFPVASGGIHPGLVAANVNVLGKDCVVNAGGGIHGHPMGTRSGAKAMMQAIGAYMEATPLEVYAKTHEELRLALETWGYKYGEEDA